MLHTLIGLAILAIPNLNRIARFFERLFAWIVDAPQAIGKAIPVLTGDSVAWAMMAVGLAIIGIANFPQKYRDRLPRPFKALAEERPPDIPNAIDRELTRLWGAIRETGDFIKTMTEQTAQIQDLKTEIVIQRDLEPRLASIERAVENIGTRLAALERDVSVLLYYALYDLNLRTPRDLLASAPALDLYYEQEDITPAWLEEQRGMADDFVTRAEKALRYTPRYNELLSTLQISENEADRQVRAMPADRRPRDIDPFDLRTYVISTHKCAQVIVFIEREEAQMTEKTAAQRDAIQERYSLKNP